MLPKIEENFSEDDDGSDVEDIVEEDEECIDEADDIHEEEEDDAWECDEDIEEGEKNDRPPIIMDTQTLRHLKSEKKVIQYEGSPLRSEPDDDIL